MLTWLRRWVDAVDGKNGDTGDSQRIDSLDTLRLKNGTRLFRQQHSILLHFDLSLCYLAHPAISEMNIGAIDLLSSLYIFFNILPQ